MSIDPRQFDDSSLDREIKDALGDMSLAELDPATFGNPHAARPDEHGRVRGRIVAIRDKDVFVDIGGKSEAFVGIDEFDPAHPPQPGQTIDFVMQGLDAETGQMKLSLREARIEADWHNLKVGDVIEARVSGQNIGGLELSLGGRGRGFMPKSQVDLTRHENFASFMNKKLECEVLEIDRRGKSVLLSHRRVLERRQAELREQLKFQLAEGQTRHGVVRRITDFGAFVDLGGIEGLLHVSDLSHARVKHPSDLLKVGGEVEVKILKIDLVKDRISLGMKQLGADPWDLVAANYRAGAQVDGRVTRLMDFGAFVELEPGVEGLIPISELSWTQRVRHPKDVLKEGDSVRCAILAVDVEKRRISLSLKAMGADPWQGIAERYVVDSVVSGAVMRITEFGAFVQLEEGVEGLVHISQLSDQRVRRVSDVVEPGKVVQVRILSVDAQQRRISLSMKIAGGAAEPAPSEAPAPVHKPKPQKPRRGGLAF